jgi:hypothetical protein
VIARLLAEAPCAPGQTPALDCVVMFGNGQAVRGALSITPEGALRLLSPGTEGNRPLLVEQFFDYPAISAIAVTREITTEARRIVVPASS